MSGRIRSIKPEWLEDELMSAASSDARVLSIAMILMADDYGNGRCHRASLAGRVFPPSCDSQEDLLRSYTRFSSALDELSKIRFVGVYQVNGQHYFAIRKWSEHQKVNHPGKPLVPGPPEGLFNSSCESLASLCPDLRPTTNDQRPGGEVILARAHEAENPDASLPPPPPVNPPLRSRVETTNAGTQPGQRQAQPPKVAHSEPPTPKPPSAGNVAPLPTRRQRATGDLRECPIGELAQRCRANPYDAAMSGVGDRPELQRINQAWADAVGLKARPLGSYSDKNRTLIALLEAFETTSEADLLRACEQAKRDDWCTGKIAGKGDSPRKRDIGCLSQTVLRRLLDACEEQRPKFVHPKVAAMLAEEQRRMEGVT